MTTNVTMEVGRTDHGATRLVEAELNPLADGDVRLRIDKFALTANNITYAEVGDMLGYWDFFPTGDPEWGRVPAMGWADVVESNVEGIAVGGRYYGWWPMSRYVDLTATPIPDGLRDDGDHRQQHAPTYRRYLDTTADPMYPTDASGEALADLEDRHALLRGLFLTGFLIDAFVADLPGGVDQSILLSASSKTAIGTARCGRARGARTVGVTSAGNADFVRSLGCYDDVVTYGEIASIPETTSAVVDMSGNSGVVAAVHEHLGDLIKSSLIVGKSHHDAAPAMVTAGPAQEFFFAPTEVERRLAEWGPDEYRKRMVDGLAEFVDASREWLTTDHRTGPEALETAWAQAYAGDVPPNTGVIVSA